MQISVARPEPCPTVRAEPRGPGYLLAGLCVTCGLATIYRNQLGHPEHQRETIK